MHNHSLRRSARRRERSTSPAATLAEALVVVLDNAPLPTSTLAALRLVCRGTKLIVDNSVTNLVLPLGVAEGLSKSARALISGLTSLCLDISPIPSSSSVKRPYAVANYNASTLQKLTFTAYMPCEYLDRQDMPRRAAVSTLGTCKLWPHLTEIHVFSVATAFTNYIKIDSMPKLTDLKLYGMLRGDDLTALRRGKHFCATLQRLSLKISVSVASPDHEFYNALKKLLQDTFKLRHLSLDVAECRCRDLGFLADAELSSLRELHLTGIPGGVSLFPITETPRNSLESLKMCGGTVSVSDLRALVSAALPALKDIDIHFTYSDSSFLRDVNQPGLTRLALRRCITATDDVAHVAAALTRLPLLDQLVVHPWFLIDDFEPDEAMEHLLSGPPLPRLRRLETGGAWIDNDDSIEVLAEYADKLPNLEEFAMINGFIGSTGLARLAATGRAGQWPHLRLLHFDDFDVEDFGENELEEGLERLREAWPGLEIMIG